MSNILEVREYDTITCNKDYENSSFFRYLDEKHFQELEHFIREYISVEKQTDILEFMRIGYRRNVGNTISFNSYVGVIELPSGFQIEILPKISFDDEDAGNKKIKKTFLNMLSCLKEFEGKTFGDASLNVDRMNLYEIFINMFLKETRNLVKHGLKSSYIQRDENLKYFKGKLLISENIKANMTHKERFYVQYDEYQVNRPENRLIKATLLKLQAATKNIENSKEIKQLLTGFELVDTSVNYEKDFAKVSIGRDTNDYKLLIQWAKVFLLNKSFTTFSGEKAGKALLFPMETVFEAFIAKGVKTALGEMMPDKINVSSQDKGYYLFDEPQKFRLRPDIVVRRNEKNMKTVVIMDTKWKKLNSNSSVNYGISQADMYQMYAYAKKYHSSEIWLLYPWHSEVAGLSNVSYEAVEGAASVSVYVFFVKLDPDHYKNSIRELCAQIVDSDDQYL